MKILFIVLTTWFLWILTTISNIHANEVVNTNHAIELRSDQDVWNDDCDAYTGCTLDPEDEQDLYTEENS